MVRRRWGKGAEAGVGDASRRLLTAGARGVARVEVEGAEVVAHDGDLVRLHAHQLAHLDDLLERLREEEALGRHQPLLTTRLGEHQHRRLVVDVDRVLDAALGGDLVLAREDGRLAALDAQLPPRLVEQLDVLVALHLVRLARLADVLVRAREEELRARDDTLVAREGVGHHDVLQLRQPDRRLLTLVDDRLERIRHHLGGALDEPLLAALGVEQPDVLVLLEHDLALALARHLVRVEEVELGSSNGELEARQLVLDDDVAQVVELRAQPLRRRGEEGHIHRGARTVTRLDPRQVLEHELLIRLKKSHAGAAPRGHPGDEQQPDDAEGGYRRGFAERRQHLVVPEWHDLGPYLVEEWHDGVRREWLSACGRGLLRLRRGTAQPAHRVRMNPSSCNHACVRFFCTSRVAPF